MIAPAIERELYRYIRAKGAQTRCRVLEVGGTADHLHVLVSIPPVVSLAGFVKTVKGASSHHINEVFSGHHLLYWQVGYDARSISADAVGQVRRYIQSQKVHHASGDVDARLETADRARPDQAR